MVLILCQCYESGLHGKQEKGYPLSQTIVVTATPQTKKTEASNRLTLLGVERGQDEEKV